MKPHTYLGYFGHWKIRGEFKKERPKEEKPQFCVYFCLISPCVWLAPSNTAEDERTELRFELQPKMWSFKFES